MLALAGCDLEIPKDKELVYAQGGMEVSELPVTKPSIVKDDSLEPLYGVTKADGTEWTTADGLSISFYLEGYTNDWSMIFQVPSGNWGTTTAHQCENSGWVANAFGNAAGNGVWDQFNNVECYVTISISADGYMKFYKDGELVTTYGGDAPGGFAVCEFKITPGKWVQNILSDIENEGIYCIHPTDSWANGNAGDYFMTYFIVDRALSDEEAKDLSQNYKTYFEGAE